MRKSLPYVLPVIAILFLIFLWWQNSQKKPGSISDTAEQIEVVAITPSPDKLQLSDSAVSRLELRAPQTPEQAEPTDAAAQNQEDVTGEIRSLVENDRLIFSVLLLRAVAGRVSSPDSPTAVPSDQASLPTNTQTLSTPAVWIKAAGSSTWQLVCQVTDSKGGLQCGGSIALSDLPVAVAVTASASTNPAGGPVLLEGELPAP